MASLELFRHIDRLMDEEKNAFIEDLGNGEKKRLGLSILLYDPKKLSFHHKGLQRANLKYHDITKKCEKEHQEKYLKVILRHLRLSIHEKSGAQIGYKNRKFYSVKEKKSESKYKPDVGKTVKLINENKIKIIREMKKSYERWVGKKDKFRVRGEEYEDSITIQDVKEFDIFNTNNMPPGQVSGSGEGELFVEVEKWLGLHPKKGDIVCAQPIIYANQFQGLIYVFYSEGIWEEEEVKQRLKRLAGQLSSKIFQAKAYSFEKAVLEGNTQDIDDGASYLFFKNVERVLNVVGGVMVECEKRYNKYHIKCISKYDGISPYKLQVIHSDFEIPEYKGIFEGLEGTSVHFKDVDEVDKHVIDNIHSSVEGMMKDLVDPKSKIVFHYKFEDQGKVGFCLYFYESKEELMQEGRQINATLSRMIATVERAEKLRRTTRRAKDRARRNAVSTVMLRNFAHNIGSHVAANTTNEKVKERIRNLYDQ